MEPTRVTTARQGAAAELEGTLTNRRRRPLASPILRRHPSCAVTHLAPSRHLFADTARDDPADLVGSPAASAAPPSELSSVGPRPWQRRHPPMRRTSAGEGLTSRPHRRWTDGHGRSAPGEGAIGRKPASTIIALSYC